MTSYTRVLCCCLLLAGVAGMGGCGGSNLAPADAMLSGRVGDICSVYFRHDALGMAADGPSSPTAGGLNGINTQVSGKLVRQNAEWVVVKVEEGNRELSIPKSVILMVEVASK